MSPRKTLSQKAGPTKKAGLFPEVDPVHQAAGRLAQATTPLEQLRRVHELEAAATKAERALALKARAAGAAWSEIGAALGISPQGAYARCR